MNEFRIYLNKKLILVYRALKPGPECLQEIFKVTGCNKVEWVLDASASDSGRRLTVHVTHEWGRIAFFGEENFLFIPSRYYSWTKNHAWLMSYFSLENRGTCWTINLMDSKIDKKYFWLIILFFLFFIYWYIILKPLLLTE